MAKNLKWLLIGVLLTSIVFVSFTAFANNSTTIQASLNAIGININGNKVANIGDSYTLDNGTQVPFSILYKGTTYLPIRKVGELMGKYIGYDSGTKTALVSDTPIPTPTPKPTPAPQGQTFTIEPESINELQTGLEDLLNKYVSNTNMSNKWYDRNNATALSMMGAKTNEVYVNFSQPVDIKELYTFCSNVSYKFRFIDSNNNIHSLIFPTIELSELSMKNYSITSYYMNRCKINLSNIKQVKITVEQLFKTRDSCLPLEEHMDMMHELELNGSKSNR